MAPRLALLLASILWGVPSCAREDPAAPPPASFEVVVTGVDPAWKIRAIKAVREETGLGLADAKDLVEHVPFMLKEGLSAAEAADTVRRLGEAGLKAEARRP
jgi:large subunit ribosomal protein L7/L12